MTGYAIRTLLIMLLAVPAFAQVGARREVIVGESLWRADCDSPDGWKALHNTRLSAAGGILRVEATGSDPYFAGPDLKLAGPLMVKLRMRSRMPGNGEIFWKTADNNAFIGGREAPFDAPRDDGFAEVSVFIDEPGTITGLRIDPGTSSGVAEIDSIEIFAAQRHPLEITEVRSDAAGLTLSVRNHAAKPITAHFDGRPITLAAGATQQLPAAGKSDLAFEIRHIELHADGLSPLKMDACIHRPDVPLDAETIRSGPLTVELARNGAGARILRDNKLIAILAPLIIRDGAIPPLKITRSDRQSLTLSGDKLTCRLTTDADQLKVHIESDTPCEGPVLRAFGKLRQGLFAGLEYLGAGERSSSTLDLETDAHWRFAPDPLLVTMPLMACVTDQASSALTWRDMSLQPTYATPNFIDGADDHRISLRGKTIDATILLSKPQSIEELILWGVKQSGGLPELPKPPRTREQARTLALETLHGPLRTDKGWGHCVEENWARQPFADMASTIFRLSGKILDMDFVPGGAHIRNDAIFFVSNRAQHWLDARRREAKSLIAEQKPDGSWRYAGKYLKGHYEDTASGFCAAKAARLLEFALMTNDPAARDAGLKALDYMKRFDVPRGAQTWELSLHTPDILASAHLVDAYVSGYRLTGNAQYVLEARRWALSGVPFVYLWSRYPVMAYNTIAVYGATNWQAPNWIGLPVQWCGIDYAYALLRLADHDVTLDWKKLAHGILIAGEQMQYTEGRERGCLPDSWVIDAQSRNGPAINPCAIMSLKMALDGEVDSLAIARSGNHVVVAPFPVTIEGAKARLKAPKGLTYQLIIDGKRTVSVTSTGQDQIRLGE